MSSPLDTFTTGTYTVTRPGAVGHDADTGYETVGASTTFTVLACIQPAEGRTLQKLDAGQRQRDPHDCWTETALRTSDEQGRVKHDVVTLDGLAYQVERVREWGGDSFPHYHSVLLRQDPA